MKPHWIKAKSSHSSNSCIELSHDLKHIRDSKDPGGPILTVNARVFIHAIRQGHFDR